ncbi:hypothetical protein PAXRUDRAFT_19738 [Paxillus rubicundulus Ve08.2h10]|uniref:Uncharacterized protein n=1 Tax=Paxillus rubicundulus Ve08.2h10 TaxID=930991 RepID=A0A0D0DBE4_9AGAM|nr:hypothetical protein PAXRUDRAFT_19738 [Paxillus rubicundulus Ve08.2h10]
MTAAQPTLIHLPGSRMTTTKKAARPKQMTKAQWTAERMDDIESEDEDPIGNMVVGSTSSADRMTAMPTPAPPSTPPCMPIPVPNPAQQRQGHQGCQRGAPQPLAAPQPMNACSTCIDFGVLCKQNPGYLCFTAGLARKTGDIRQHPATRKSPRSSQHGIQQYGDHIAHPAFTSHLMVSAPNTSAVKAPVNMGLIPWTAYSLGGNPLVSHEEHRAALQRLETMEVENCKLHGLIT